MPYEAEEGEEQGEITIWWDAGNSSGRDSAIMPPATGLAGWLAYCSELWTELITGVLRLLVIQ